MALKEVSVLVVASLALAGCISVDRNQSTSNQVVVNRHMSSGSDSQAFQLAKNYCSNYSKEARLLNVEQPRFLHSEYYTYTYNCIDTFAVAASVNRDDDQKCLSYGAVQGSSEYITCRLKLQEMRNNSANTTHVSTQPSNNKTLENQILLDSASRLLNLPRQSPAMPKTCSVVGGIMRCW